MLLDQRSGESHRKGKVSHYKSSIGNAGPVPGVFFYEIHLNWKNNMNRRLLIPILLGTLFASYAVVRAQTPSKSVWDGVYTEDQAAKGKELYSTHCSSCHSDSMEGGEMAPALAGGAFSSNWAGLTAGDLFDRIRTTMPLNTPGKLSREINANILAYIFKFNAFPAGSAELSQRSEYLKEIRIDASKK